MSKKFVSLDRLGTFLDQIKKLIPTSVATTSAQGLMSAADKTKLNNTNIAYATCSTAATTAAKEATITGNDNWTLTVGAIVCVKFSYSNSASNCTLNVNGTGAKQFWWSTAVYTGTSGTICGYASRYHYYMYDGTYWVWMGKSSDDNTTYNPMTLGGGYGTCATAEATTAKVATLSSYSLVTGGKPVIKFTYAVPASATLNINSRGAKAIYYMGAAITAGIIAAGDTVTFIYDGSYYHVLAIDKAATEYVKSISISGKTVTITKGDGSTSTQTTQDTNTTYSTGTASASGLTKLYTATGTAIDGTMTQAAITSALAGIPMTTSAYWHNSFTSGVRAFYYEGQDTTTYKLPSKYCIVIVAKYSASRGVAIAVQWQGSSTTSTTNIWASHLHDDTASNSWSNWTQVADLLSGVETLLAAI